MMPHPRRTFLAGLALLFTTALPAAGQTRRPARPLPEVRVVVTVDAAVQSANRRFSDRIPIDQSLESGRIDSAYRVRSGLTFDGGAFVRLWKAIGAGVAVSSYTKSGSDAIEGEIPHPFFFNQGRTFSGTAVVDRRETAVHVRGTWSQAITRSLLVTGFAGPSRIEVEQDLVSDVNYSDTYPYDAVTFGSAVVRSVRASRIGFNAGADVTWRLANHVGVGGTVSYSGVRVPLRIDNRTLRVKAGGAVAGGGVRLLF